MANSVKYNMAKISRNMTDVFQQNNLMYKLLYF